MRYDRQDCSLARSLEAVGDRWTLLIVRDAFYGVRRFNDFQAHLDAPRAVLAERLESMVGDGIMERLPDPDHAGRHLYELSAAGRELWPAVHALMTWGGQHRGPNSRTFAHAPCGTTIDERGSCPACGVTPAAQDVVANPRRRRGGTRPRTDRVARALTRPHRLLEPLDL
jgi:DNA-binding HxlR family transcriptional regulator